MSCSSTSLTTVQLSGACASGETVPSPSSGAKYFWISSSAAGSCHYDLVFANGYEYAGDVEFVANDPGCGCQSYLVPSQGIVSIDNPTTTCVSDVGDAAVDTGSDVTTDAMTDER
jgi:hypothetical protein